MPETITISKEKPAIKSMDFDFLKAEGIRRIQEMAGNIWTDYNEHDPGVTILEALCYALTDLGYRTSFDMRDLLAPNPNDQIEDDYDFYTARQILHNNPLTIQDYRKLLMDVSLLVGGPGLEEEIIGIKNAWLTVADSSEYAVFVNRAENLLDYVPPKIGDQTPLDLKVLYDVVLEFSDSKNYGDLNQDTLEDNYDAFHPNVVALFLGQDHDQTIELAPYDQDLYDRVRNMSVADRNNALAQVRGVLDLVIKAKVEFPRWDETDLNWSDINAIKKSIRSISLVMINLSDDLEIRYRLDEDNNILLASVRQGLKEKPVPFLDDITHRINCLILGKVDSLIKTYQQKVFAILEILAKAKARLNAHRNLCEDFYRFNALKVEEILVCADIEIDNNANIAEVEGHIFFELDKFLSPTVNFYSLDEYLQKDLEDKKYAAISVNKNQDIITVFNPVKQSLVPGQVLTLSGFGPELIELTIKEIARNQLNEDFTDILTNESLQSLTATEEGFLFIGRLAEEEVRATEEVFLGPALNNGFIDNEELAIADRRSTIQASDVINLIMDVPGVKAIKKLELANFPQDENPEVPSQAVRWCLRLAVDKNYVPRISTAKSRLTYYKDGLPFQAGKLESEAVYQSFKDAQRPQKQFNPILDFDIPEGDYRYLSEYVSIQDDLPLTYGVGPDGVPLDDSFNLGQEEERRAKARQLKGFLMIFDQLLANYLAQLDRMKDLFSFNPERKLQLDGGDVLPETYNFQVNKTYFSQPIFDVVNDADPLYSYFTGPANETVDKQAHEDRLQQITESRAKFVERRNKFLDHLIARFGEQFTDYALLTARIESRSQEELDLELIEDKQDFLSVYPEVSANRGKAFDYKDPAFWSLDNVSGLEKRVSFLSGIDPVEPADLQFNPKLINIWRSDDEYKVAVLHEGETILLLSGDFTTEEAAKLAVEELIMCGVCKENYYYQCRKHINSKFYKLVLRCGGRDLVFQVAEFTSRAEVRAAVDLYAGLFEQEFFENPLANRKNYTLPFHNYFQANVDPADIDLTEGTYKVVFRLYAQPFSVAPEEVLLAGEFVGNIEPKDGEDLDNIINTALERVKERFWEIVYLGREACQYDPEGNQIQIIDRLGDELASGNTAQINDALTPLFPLVEEGAVQDQALSRLSMFFERYFFRQEGFHLLEHILLRPKVNNLWVPAEPNFIREIPEQDSLIPVDYDFADFATISDNQIVLEGDVTELLAFNQQITLSIASATETFTIASFQEKDGKTYITIRQGSLRKFHRQDKVSVGVLLEVRIVDIREEDLVLVLEPGTDEALFAVADELTIKGARDGNIYGQFKVGAIAEEASGIELTLSEFKVRDKLLPLYLPTPDNDIEDPADCDTCKIDNPYSYIAQVVVPGWPGRLDNIDFRKYFERAIRMEAPAQIFLNICWVGFDQMEAFERRYKRWLLENLKPFPVKPYDASDKERLTTLSGAKGELIEILYELRNVYPVRSLHDCDEGESTEGAIILNQTALGEI